jgi:hypothetical protein
LPLRLIEGDFAPVNYVTCQFWRGINYLLTFCEVAHMTTFRQIKSPVGLAAFGAFFVPEPLGMCLVFASGIWWLTRITAMTQLMSHDSEGQRIPAWLQYATVLLLGTCFLIGVWVIVQSPAFRPPNQPVFGDNVLDKSQNSGLINIAPSPVSK